MPDAGEPLQQGLRLLAENSPQRAAEIFQKVVAQNPNDPQANHLLGVALAQWGRPEEAQRQFRRTLSLKPDFAEALQNLGGVLFQQKKFAESIDAYRRAIALRPNYAQAHFNLGVTLEADRQLTAAAQTLRRCIELQPDHPAANLRLGIVCHGLCQLTDAEAALSRHLSAHPDDADAHWSLAQTLLLAGQWEQGWREYEWRWKSAVLALSLRTFDRPQWVGTPPSGKTILLHWEQGFGDAIQFIRYAPLLQKAGANVIAWCQPELKPLLQSVDATVRIVTTGDTLPGFDVHCPLCSLPGLFQTRPDAIPAETPYLRADPDRAEFFRSRLDENRPRVGLAWAGNRTYAHDRQRSISPPLLEPILQTPKMQFVSLQLGEDIPGDSRLADYSSHLGDFADTAALIENLDLVISVDTAVAHLSAAMGKETWLLLPFCPSFRWLLNRDDSPWYPSIRLFRQTELDNWTGPIERAADALRSRISRDA